MQKENKVGINNELYGVLKKTTTTTVMPNHCSTSSTSLHCLLGNRHRESVKKNCAAMWLDNSAQLWTTGVNVGSQVKKKKEKKRTWDYFCWSFRVKAKCRFAAPLLVLSLVQRAQPTLTQCSAWKHASNCGSCKKSKAHRLMLRGCINVNVVSLRLLSPGGNNLLSASDMNLFISHTHIHTHRTYMHKDKG